MTGVSFTVEVDDLTARDRISALIDRMDNPVPFYKSVGEHLVNSAKANFDREAAPDGTAWTPLMQSTIRRRMKNGQTPIQILTATKRLKASIIYQLEADGLKVGSPVEYAAIHQLGGVINRPARTGKAFGRDAVALPAYTITMPARPYLGLSRDDEVEIIELAEAWLGEE